MPLINTMFVVYILHLNRLGKLPAITMYNMFTLFHKARVHRTLQLSKCTDMKKKLCNRFPFLWTTRFSTSIFVSTSNCHITAGWFFLWFFDSPTHEWHIFLYLLCSIFTHGGPECIFIVILSHPKEIYFQPSNDK